MYKVIKNENGTALILENADGSIICIPEDPANSDYATYLAWVAKGNTATLAANSAPQEHSTES
jgi:hypothetical protein